MPPPTILPCPAKLNLFLEIRGKRQDGYHELGTLFQAVNFGDSLGAEPWDGIEVICDRDITGKPEENLVYKAAKLIQARYAEKVMGRGIRYFLTKRIPTGAGLGGGSSDAATALRLADTLWDLNLTDSELLPLARELGADVAFFLSTPTAFAEGRGEILSPAPSPFPFHVVIATPHCHVETAWAYHELQGKKFASEWGNFKSQYASKSAEATFYKALHNDFEEPIATHFPEIREVRSVLNSFQPVKSLLTGSGASLFALFQEEEKARNCLNAVAPHCRFSILTHFKTGEFC